MTRKEREELARSNKLKKNTRILKTLELFTTKNGNITDLELAEELKKLGIETSSSTVGRDLSINLKNLFLEENKKIETNKIHLTNDGFTNEQVSILAFVKKKRIENKHLGQIKGGTISILNNDIIRDKETGHFNGSSRKTK